MIGLAPRCTNQVTPTTVATGTPGSSARTYSMSPCMAPLYIHNSAAGTAYIRLNDPSNPATASYWTYTLLTGESMEVSLGGRIRIEHMSVYLAAGSYTSIAVGGFYPTD